MINVWGIEDNLWQPCFAPSGSSKYRAIGIMVCGHLEEGVVSKGLECCACRKLFDCAIHSGTDKS